MLGGSLQARAAVAQLCCEAEVGLIKQLLEPLDGVINVKVSAVGRVALVEHGPPTNAQALLETLNRGTPSCTSAMVRSAKHIPIRHFRPWPCSTLYALACDGKGRRTLEG